MNKIDKSKIHETIVLEDISQALQLSKSTVSRAISGKGRISLATRQRVLAYIEEHNYRPNSIARSLAESKSYNIGVILPEDENIDEKPFFLAFLIGFCKAVSLQGYDTLVTVVNEKDLLPLQRLIHDKKVDGVVLTRMIDDDGAVNFLKEKSIPFIVIGSSPDEVIFQVDSDHEMGCFELTSYLLALGYPKIGLLIGDVHHKVNRSRYQGYKRAWENRELFFPAEYVCENITEKLQIAKGLELLLKENVTCILCGDDMICAEVLLLLQEQGKVVPQDVKVASFHDSSFLADYNPPITALHIDTQKLGVVAGQTILDIIGQKTVPAKQLLDYEIILRKSTQVDFVYE